MHPYSLQSMLAHHIPVTSSSLYRFLPSPHPFSPHSSSLSPDLVRPAKLPNLRISDGTVFSWNYPESWEKPCSFFGLQFQVKVVKAVEDPKHPCNSEGHIMVFMTFLMFIKWHYCKNEFADQFNHIVLIVSHLLLFRVTSLKLSTRLMSKPRSMFSVCELRTSTPVGHLATGAIACKYFTWTSVF